jgi:YVTN family beta-propeller protein
MSSKLSTPLIVASCVALCQGHAGAQVAAAAGDSRPAPQEARQAAKPGAAPAARSIVREGMTIDFALSQYDPGKQTRELREGDTVTIGFEFRDAGSGNPVSSLNPAAWMTAVRKTSSAAGCSDQVKTALGSSMLARPEVDLNAFYVLSLNADATITVVDPVFGYGGTKLLAMIPLRSPGEDWAITSDQNRLFVSMPGANQVAVIDTRSWAVKANVDAGPAPSRVRLQPDEAYLWIDYLADPKSDARPGVAILSTQTLKIVARIPTGGGAHDIAFSDDSRFAFVMNADEGTVSVIDVRSLRKIRDIPVGARPSSIAFSKLAQAFYVTSQEAGTITAISAGAQEVIARIAAEPGLGQLRFAPGDRLGFAVNHRRNTVSVVDAALNRIVQTADVEEAPDQLAFSTRFAYIRHRDSEIVRMIPLSELGKDGAAVPLLDFPGGQNVLGKASRSSLAAAIVPAADDNAVLVVNPGDKAIYYYQEGMAAPMGNFSNYGKEPLAVLVVDRSLRETRPGAYRSTVRLPQAGEYNVLLFVNSPRVVHCFDVSIAPSLDASSPSNTPPARIESLTHQPRVQTGDGIRLTMRLMDGRTGTPIVDARDALALIVAPGVWQARQPVEHVADGVYALTVVPPAPGIYNVYVTSPSLRLTYTRVLAFEATDVK